MYDRELEGKEHNFGVVGVDEGTLIMYDDETQSYWSQLIGKAVSGDMEGTQLEKIPSTSATRTSSWVSSSTARLELTLSTT